MDKLSKRLSALETQRPDSVQLVTHMTDAQLIQIITGGQATDITGEALQRIVEGESWEALKNESQN